MKISHKTLALTLFMSIAHTRVFAALYLNLVSSELCELVWGYHGLPFTNSRLAKEYEEESFTKAFEFIPFYVCPSHATEKVYHS